MGFTSVPFTDKYRLYASASFILLILVLGLPMWWKTTEVYRVQLPYGEIQDLSRVEIMAKSTVYIYTELPGRSKMLETELQDMYRAHRKCCLVTCIYSLALMTHHLFLPSFVLLTDKLRVSFVALDPERIPATTHLHTPYELEKVLMKLVPLQQGEFIFAEWRNLTEDVLVTSGRIAYISGETSAKKIEQVLRMVVFQEHKLNVVNTDMRRFEDLKDSRGIGEPVQPATDIVVTVINPDAKMQRVLWDVPAAVEGYLIPFLDKLSLLTRFNLKTQWKYQVSFGQQLEQVQDSSRLRRHYALPEKTLTHFVTALEHSIGRGISTNPNLQIVVYVPPCSQAPMQIYSKAEQRVSNGTTSSFLSTKWGGVIVHNPPEELCERALSGEEHGVTQVPVDSHEVMTVALHLLRKLLEVDLDVASSVTGTSLEELTRLTPRDWELDAYLRSGLVNLLNSVTITLQSLVQLLNDINYIVINDDVGNAIKLAYSHLVEAKRFLANNELQQATEHAKEAFKHSERAFFDPSLLALLYFPDEQK